MDEERGHFDDANTGSTLVAPRSSRKLHVILGSIVAVGLILSVSIGVGMNNDSSSSSSTPSTANETPKDAVPTSTTSTNGATTPTTPSNGQEDVSFLAAITPQSIQETYGSCDALKPDLKVAARMMGNAYIEMNAYYFDEGFADMYMIATAEDSGETAEVKTETKAGQKSSTSNNPWGTNNQHDGVEEADMTQSNGVDVFIVYGTEIVTVTAATMTEKSRTQVETGESDNCYSSGMLRNMLLVEDSLVVFSEVYCDVMYNNTDLGDSSNGNYMYYGSSTPSTKVFIYDTTTMKLRTSSNLSGMYMAARAVGPNVVVATSATIDTYTLTQYLDPYTIQSSTTTVLTMDTYRTLAQAELEKRLDSYVTTMSSQMDCTSLQKLTVMQNTNSTMSGSLAHISSFSATAATINISSTSMLVAGSYWYVYASNNTMVLSLDGAFMDPMMMDAAPETYIVTFEFDGAGVKPGKLGKVPGYVMGPNSLDHITKNGKDYIRVASTSSTWSENMGMSMGGMGDPETTSQVTVLEMTEGSDGFMPVAGQLTGLGKPGDRIYSVLFQGDRAFVTTFNYTDPFYTIDMTDPTSPKKMGELEIPGFSTYLYAVSNNLVLGVGRSTDVDDMAVNFQISLFDVSNFSKPTRIAQFEQKAGANTNITTSIESEAEYDSKAFRYHFATKTLAIPVLMYQYIKTPCSDDFSSFTDDLTMTTTVEDDDFAATTTVTSSTNSSSSSSAVSSTNSSLSSSAVSSSTMAPSNWECYNTESTGEGFDGFKLYKIDATNGITEHFSIAHATGAFMDGGCYGYGYMAARSLIFGNDIMTMKGHTVMSHDLTTKAEAATPIDLDDGNTDCSDSYFYGETIVMV